MLQRKCSGCGSGPACTGCQDEEGEAQGEARLQRHAVDGGAGHGGAAAGAGMPAGAPAGVPRSVRDVLSAPGAPLPADARREMEAGFGHDFSKVRVHPSSPAAGDVGAHAFTVGSHVVFAPGTYAPGTPSGRRLLAHELAHVVQQSQAGSVDLDRLAVDTAVHGASEREADAAAEAVLAGGRNVRARWLGGPRIQRHAACAHLLNAPDAGVRGIGSAAHAAIQGDFASRVPGATALPIPGGSSTPLRSEGCEEDEAPTAISPQKVGGAAGLGFPDLVLRRGKTISIAEIKVATWTCVPMAESQVLNYMEKGNAPENREWRKANEVRLVRPMTPAQYMPQSPIPVAGASVLVSWCAPGLIVYKAVGKRKRKRKREEAKQEESKKATATDPAKAEATTPADDPAAETEGAGAAVPVPVPAGAAAKVSEGEQSDAPPIEDPGFPQLDWATAARVAANLARELAKRAPKSAAGTAARGAGPVYAAATVAAALILVSQGAEASVGLEGDDAIEALFKSAADNGVELPEDLKEAIKNDEGLKEALKKASNPETADEAKRELGERMLRVISENRDQFTDEELEVLMQAGEGTGALPEGDVSVAEIKEQIARKKQAEGKGPGLGLGPSDEAPAEPEPGAEEPPPIEMSDETKERLAESPHTRTVLKALLKKSGGEKVDEEFVKSLLDVVAQADPPLTDDEVAAMTQRVGEGATKQEALDSVRSAIAGRGQEPAPGAAPGQEAGSGEDTEAQEPAGEEEKAGGGAGERTEGDEASGDGEKTGGDGEKTGGEADGGQPAPGPAKPPTPTLPMVNGDTSDAAKKKAAAATGDAATFAGVLKEPKTKAMVERLDKGVLYVAYGFPAKIFAGAVFPRTYLIGVTEDGRAVMGACTMKAVRPLGGDMWEALVSARGLYFETGEAWGIQPPTKIQIDWAKIVERRKQVEEQQKQGAQE